MTRLNPWIALPFSPKSRQIKYLLLKIKRFWMQTSSWCHKQIFYRCVGLAINYINNWFALRTFTVKQNKLNFLWLCLCHWLQSVIVSYGQSFATVQSCARSIAASCPKFVPFQRSIERGRSEGDSDEATPMVVPSSSSWYGCKNANGKNNPIHLTPSPPSSKEAFQISPLCL